MESVEEEILEEINHLEIGRSEGTRMVFFFNIYILHNFFKDVENYERLLEEQKKLEHEMGKTVVDVGF